MTVWNKMSEKNHRRWWLANILGLVITWCHFCLREWHIPAYLDYLSCLHRRNSVWDSMMCVKSHDAWQCNQCVLFCKVYCFFSKRSELQQHLLTVTIQASLYINSRLWCFELSAPVTSLCKYLMLVLSCLISDKLTFLSSYVPWK